MPKRAGATGHRRRRGCAAFVCGLVTAYTTGGSLAAKIQSFDLEVHYSPGTIHWVDDRHLALKALVSVGGERPTQYGGRRIGKLAVLDIETRQIQWGEEFTGALCVNGNQVAYFTVQETIGAADRSERFFVSYGPLSKLATREVKRQDLQAQGFDFEYNCKPVSDMPTPVHPGNVVKQLYAEHGFVEFERTAGNRYLPFAMYRTARPHEPVALNVLRHEDVLFAWPFIKFKNAYWIASFIRVSPPRPPGTYKAWWLHPDGRVTVAVEVDLQSTLNGAYSLVPTLPVRDGLLAIEGRSGRTPLGNIGQSGLYRLNTKRGHEKLLAGTVSPWAVSPNGCRVAVGNDDRQDDGGSERLIVKVLDVCRVD